MLHENEGRTNIFKADQTKLVRGTDIFSENFGPRTVISGTNFPLTGLLAMVNIYMLYIQRYVYIRESVDSLCRDETDAPMA